MKLLYYHLEDLPSIPDCFVPDLLARAYYERRQDTSQNHLRPEYRSRMISNIATNEALPSTRSQRYQTSADFADWVRKNVVDDYTECSISVTEHALGCIHGAHTDWTRHWILIYPFVRGGARCQTTWYQQHGQDVRRSDLGCYVTDYSQIQILDHVIMQERSWFALDTRVLHGVENIECDRITVQIGLWHLDGVRTKLLSKAAVK